MSDILDDLVDLHKQATTERSHYYVAKVAERAIAEIKSIRTQFSGGVSKVLDQVKENKTLIDEATSRLDGMAHERERCAKIADAYAERCDRGSAVSSMAEDSWGAVAARAIAKAIREQP